MQEEIIKILNSGNVEAAVGSLSFPERKRMLHYNTYAVQTLLDCLRKKNLKLFNLEETVALLDDHYDDEMLHKAKKLLSFPYGISYLPTSCIQWALILIKNPERLLTIKKLDGLAIPYEIVPDDILEKRITTCHNSLYELYEMVSAFKSDDLKIKYLNKVSHDSRCHIIASMSDENKKKCFSPFLLGKDIVISKLNDEDKNTYLNTYKAILNDEQKGDIIASFESPDFVRKNINLIKTDRGRLNIISSFRKFNVYNDIITNLALSLKHEKNIADCVTGFINDNVHKELIPNLISKIKTSKYVYELLSNIDLTKNNVYFESLLQRLNQKQLKKIAFNFNEYYCPYKIILHIKDKNYIIDILKHAFIREKYKDDMLPIFQIFAEKYNLNLDHLIELAKTLDASILSKVENENVAKAINLDDESFKKYLALFAEKNLTVGRNSMSAILNSFLNKKYSIDNPDKVQIFINTLHAVNDNNLDLAINNINEVISKIDINNYGVTPQELINGIMNENQDIIILFNKMTYEYLNNERNDYVNNESPNYLSKISSPTYDINDLVKHIIKVTPIDMIIDDIYESMDNKNVLFTNDELAILGNHSLLLELVKFKKDAGYNLQPEYKKYLKAFNNILKICYKDKQPCFLSDIKGAKIDYNSPKVRMMDVAEVLLYLDVDKLKEFVFSNPEMEVELQKYLERYGILAWNSFYRELAFKADLDTSISTIGSLISNFAYIMETKKEKEGKGERFNLVSELSLATCLDSDAEIYAYLFNQDNYRLLATNPGPNSSPESKEHRLKEALKCLNTMHERKYITVPPINDDFKLKNGKKINICLGNTNDPINLTYGERTGACMRIGGAGSTLFDFCLENENGFHISFNHPETGNLISRVSCYRNGNTLFMNQLRYSLDFEYNDDEVKEACELIAKRIIEMTKDSKYPIVNVVASDGYAYYGTKLVKSGCKNPTKGFMSKFYTDVDEQVVVVATAKENNQLLPIELGPNKTEKYEVGRAPIRQYNSDRASISVSHIEVLDAYLSNIPIDEIEFDKKEIAMAYVGEDWYVALTSDGEIINYIQNNSRNKEKANEEMQKYLMILQESLRYANIANDMENEKGQVL